MRDLRAEAGFWVAIMLAAVAAVAIVHIAANSPAGQKVPGLRQLAELIATPPAPPA